MITFNQHKARAASVPGLKGSHLSASRPTVSEYFGSMTMYRVPFFLAVRSLLKVQARDSDGLPPHMTAHLQGGVTDLLAPVP